MFQKLTLTEVVELLDTGVCLYGVDDMGHAYRIFNEDKEVRIQFFINQRWKNSACNLFQIMPVLNHEFLWRDSIHELPEELK